MIIMMMIVVDRHSASNQAVMKDIKKKVKRTTEK